MIATAFTGAGTCLETAFGRFWCHYFPEVHGSWAATACYKFSFQTTP